MTWISRFAEALLSGCPQSSFNEGPAGIKISTRVYHVRDPKSGRAIITDLNQVGHEAHLLELQSGLTSYFEKKGLDKHDVFRLCLPHSGSLFNLNGEYDHLDIFKIVGYVVNSCTYWGNWITIRGIEWAGDTLVRMYPFDGGVGLLVDATLICDAGCRHEGYLHIIVEGGRITQVWYEVGQLLSVSGVPGSVTEFAPRLCEYASNSMDFLVEHPLLLALIMEL